MKKKIACAFLSVSFLLAGTARSASFPAAGTDTTTSLGKFSINVVSAFSSIASGLTTDGFTWNASTDTLTSSLLYDPATQIYHGTPYSSTPGGPLNKVDTKIVSFDMSNGSGVNLLAGNKAINAPASTGQVTSLSSNNPAGGFPASSFFDIFVNVTLPGVNGFLYNQSSSPLLISNSSISSFPPTVVYIHGNSAAVPLYLHDPQNSTLNDSLFGYLTVAGHGVGYTNSANDVAQFEQTFNSLPSTPLPSTPADPDVSALPLPASVYFAVPALAMVFGWMRRNSNIGLA